jgi:hypothetical protein
MEPVHSTDYFAVIPKVGLPGPVIPHPISDEAFHWRLSADLSLLVMILVTAIILVTVMLNWPH